MKEKRRINIILVILILLLFILSNTVFGTLVDEFSASIRTDGASDLKTEGGKIVGIIQVVGTIVAVGMLTVIGIKYALGSVEEKAQYKKSMLPYLIGTVLIFGFSNITQIIYDASISQEEVLAQQQAEEREIKMQKCKDFIDEYVGYLYIADPTLNGYSREEIVDIAVLLYENQVSVIEKYTEYDRLYNTTWAAVQRATRSIYYEDKDWIRSYLDNDEILLINIIGEQTD